jgi:ATP-dependent phosphofructokinase / diphosphate-dependent phosphofructokinase
MSTPESYGHEKIGVLVGGGPAPGINGVISALTLEARNRGRQVVGIFDGFQWLMDGDTEKVKLLDHDAVSRIHFQGGSILNTSRANPTKKAEHLDAVLASLAKLRIGYLATIGGDDTMFSASRLAERGAGRLRVCHVPKTIDNDLPLPGDIPTFGFETARHLGFSLVRNLMEDSRATRRWYFVVVMGRTAGHLALGIGKAAGATLTVIPEEFEGAVRLKTLCDVLEGAILKRKALWGRLDGVALIAEGLLERLAPEDMTSIEGVRVTRDDYGHLRLADMDLAFILKTQVERRFAERGERLGITHKNIGYEVRCADPLAFDCEYVRALGYGAADFLLRPDAEAARYRGALVCLDNGKLRYLNFDDLLDSATGRTKIRLVDVSKPSYRIAREYMIRLEREDFDDRERLAALARAAGNGAGSVGPEEFTKKFGYLTTEIRGGI